MLEFTRAIFLANDANAIRLARRISAGVEAPVNRDLESGTASRAILMHYLDYATSVPADELQIHRIDHENQPCRQTDPETQAVAPGIRVQRHLHLSTSRFVYAATKEIRVPCIIAPRISSSTCSAESSRKLVGYALHAEDIPISSNHRKYACIK